MKMIYLAAPLSPIGDEMRELNIHRTKIIYEALSTPGQHDDCVFVAPWLLHAEVFSETEANRSLGMRRNFAVIEKCDELWLVGPRISSGMHAEADYAARHGIPVKAFVPTMVVPRVPSEKEMP